MNRAQEIITYWLVEKSPQDWYSGAPELDTEMRDRFGDDWHRAMKGDYCDWASCPEKSLALILLFDQFSRNMWRDTSDAFASDGRARKIAKKAIRMGFDLRWKEPERHFYYMPLMHSECQIDQDRCVRMILMRLQGEMGKDNLLHARVHREIIRRFGRFPTRNPALGRETKPEEAAWLNGAGYGGIMELLAA